MKSLNLISVIVILTILQLSSAYKWSKDQIPNPFSSPPPFCNLKSAGHPFCDPDSQLEPNQGMKDYLKKISN